MANSRLFQQLSKRVSKIEEYFLPEIKPGGDYSKREIDNVRAYVLLIHAEIESFFERASTEKARKAFTAWNSRNIKSNVLLALMAFCENKQKSEILSDRVHNALTHYHDKVSKNHGIKRTDILGILLPIGIEESSIDSTWLSTVDSFGSIRGEIAHNSISTQKPLDPLTLRNDVQNILSEIKIIDEMIKNIS